ncbi:MAG: polyprenyl synthetase family protein [Flavobacteriales bacterium]|nr:polyprenyl synthetase family protein [Flavobacteriales bacterium]
MTTPEEHRAAIEARINEWCASVPNDSLHTPMAYLMRLPAKRVRPVATLMACELAGGPASSAMDAAIGIEIFHNFTLMHDDVMDASPTRRGQPTVHARWNANTAILSGDAMMVKAYECLMTDQRWLPVFNRYALAVCEGQAQDMAFEARHDVSAAEYMEMIRLKTAVLLSCALELGAISGGADEQGRRGLALFGERLGLAFQLRDDHIDAFGDPAVSGKQRGGDLRAGKKTWLLIRGLELERGRGEGLLAAELGRSMVARDVGAMIECLTALGARDESEALIQSMEREAIEQLDALPFPTERKAALHALASSLMGRKA